jgi:uncharacterized protein
MTFDVVIYHHPCYDGFTAAWVASRHSPNALFVPALHGDAPPNVKGKRVLVLDFSYPLETMESLVSEAAAVTILDHHHTAKEALSSLEGAEILFDMSRSGAGLAWDYLDGGPRPKIIDHVEDRDLWRFQLEDTKAFHAGMTTVPWTFLAWGDAYTNPQEIIQAGRHVLRSNEKIATSIAQRSQETTLSNGLQVCAVNVTPEFVSEVADILYREEPSRIVLGWHWDGARGDFYCSLRSAESGPDVSAIAKIFGGGGHKHAAGFRMAKCPV